MYMPLKIPEWNSGMDTVLIPRTTVAWDFDRWELILNSMSGSQRLSIPQDAVVKDMSTIHCMHVCMSNYVRVLTCMLMSCVHVMCSCHVFMSCVRVMCSCHAFMSCVPVMCSCHVTLLSVLNELLKLACYSVTTVIHVPLSMTYVCTENN